MTTATTYAASSATNNLWISCPAPDPQAKVRLFCFPFAGAGTAVYFPWAKSLSPFIELCAVRLPGRESRLRERPHTRLAPLMEELVVALGPYFDRPFVFFGHSMGSILAFELARTLVAKGLPQPLHLIVSGHRAPQLPDPRPPLYQLSDDRFVQEMQVRYNGIPSVILENEELLRLFLPAMRADITILDTYQYRDASPFTFPISTYSGQEDPSVTLSELQAWQKQTNAEFSLTRLPGDHFYFQNAKMPLLEKIDQELVPYSLS